MTCATSICQRDPLFHSPFTIYHSPAIHLFTIYHLPFTSYVRRKLFPPRFLEMMVDWMTTQLRRRAQQGALSH